MNETLKRIANILVILNLALLAACQRRLSGVYNDANNVVSLDFKGNGMVYAKIFGATSAGNYEVKDGKVLFERENGIMFIDIIDGETLSVAHPFSSFIGELELKKQQ